MRDNHEIRIIYDKLSIFNFFFTIAINIFLETFKRYGEINQSLPAKNRNISHLLVELTQSGDLHNVWVFAFVTSVSQLGIHAAVKHKLALHIILFKIYL